MISSETYGAVGVRGVDEVHPEFDGAPQHPYAFVAVRGRAPDALAGQAHGAEAEAVDGQVAAEGERSGCLGRSFGGHITDRTPEKRPRTRGKLATWTCTRSSELPLTYPEVGATAGDRCPRATSHRARRAQIGIGPQRFEEAADAVMHWGMQRGSGLRVQASSEVVDRRRGGGGEDGCAAAPCRVVYVVDEPDVPRLRLRHPARPSGVAARSASSSAMTRRPPRCTRRCRRSPGPRPGGAKPVGRFVAVAQRVIAKRYCAGSDRARIPSPRAKPLRPGTHRLDDLAHGGDVADHPDALAGVDRSDPAVVGGDQRRRTRRARRRR